MSLVRLHRTLCTKHRSCGGVYHHLKQQPVSPVRPRQLQSCRLTPTGRLKASAAPASSPVQKPTEERAEQEGTGSNGATPAPEKTSAFLIFNPVAGQEDPGETLEFIKKKLQDTLDLTVLETTPDITAEQLTEEALSKKAQLVIASGGDGTIGAVAGKLVSTGVPLGIIPRGTANGFAVALGIPTHLDRPMSFIEAACDVIAGQHTKSVDTALVTTSEVKDFAMILLLGIGYEAEVVAAADRDLKDAVGPLAYIFAGVKKLADPPLFKAKVTVDGQNAEGEIVAITIANAAPPFSVLAHGEVGECVYDDGKLEAIAYLPPSSGLQGALLMADLLGKTVFGMDTSHELILGGRFKDLDIECDPPQKVVVDGELLGETPVKATVIPDSLVVLVPEPVEQNGVLEQVSGLVTGLINSSSSSEDDDALESMGEEELAAAVPDKESGPVAKLKKMVGGLVSGPASESEVNDQKQEGQEAAKSVSSTDSTSSDKKKD